MIELRAQQVVIDSPRKTNVPFVAITVQRLVLDEEGNIIQRINREKVINRSLQAVAFQLFNISDPLSPPLGSISGAGLGTAITDAVRTWILEEYPDFSNVNGLILKDE